ncbi:hypothetical protein F5Y14DRAFT_423174 [Nemania sp. NC0429]|nr:hypothetical protein F5Y14DRAFT_423174 [Nemania sp. NC0429]
MLTLSSPLGVELEVDAVAALDLSLELGANSRSTMGLSIAWRYIRCAGGETEPRGECGGGERPLPHFESSDPGLGFCCGFLAPGAPWRRLAHVLVAGVSSRDEAFWASLVCFSGAVAAGAEESRFLSTGVAGFATFASTFLASSAASFAAFAFGVLAAATARVDGTGVAA